MKKRDFIKKILQSKHNTVFTTKEQVETAIFMFQKFGMSPPGYVKSVRQKGGVLDGVWVDKTFEGWEDEAEVLQANERIRPNSEAAPWVVDEVKQLESKLIWLVKHAIFTASISRAKGAEILGVSLVDLDEVLKREVIK